MSFYQLPNPWNPGYVIPEYVMAEPPERGTFTTQWLPRGTISTLTPDFLVKPGRRLLGRTDTNLGSLSGNTLCGNTLRGNTLCGSTLGDDFTDKAAALMTNAGPPITPFSQAVQPIVEAHNTTVKVVAVAGVAVVALLVFGGGGKKKRRR
jgi:hypothetical protein